MNRRRERCSGRGLGSRGFKSHPQFAKDILGISKHIHEVTDRCALIPANISDAIFQQCLGDGENTLAAKHFALANA